MTGFERLIGRKKEIRDLEELLLDPLCPVVTITGIGGVGKTTVAAEIRERLGIHFPNGTYLISLSNLEHSGQLLPVMLSAVGRRSTGSEDISVMGEILNRRKMLFVLDNFEHLISASKVIKALTKGQNSSKLLITSRTMLGIPAESVYSLSGIEQPGSKVSRSIPSVQLFLHSGSLQEPVTEQDLATVSRICNTLAGVPLAIKLAAALTEGGFSLSAIEKAVNSTDDLLDLTFIDDKRKQTSLRSVFSCSWTLLTKAERQAFADLSVFRGFFHTEAASRITGASRETLDSLCRKSLLEPVENSFFIMHPLIRQFSRNMQSRHFSNLDALRIRHAEYFCGLVGTETGKRHSSKSYEAIEKLTEFYPDIEAAVHNAMQLKMISLLNSASGGLRQMYMRFGYLEAGRELFKEMMELFDQQGETEAAFSAGIHMGTFQLEKAEYDEAVTSFKKALASKDNAVHSTSLYCLGVIYIRTGNFQRAEHFLTQSLEEARAHDLTALEATALSGMGDLFNHLYDVKKSKHFMEKAVELNRSQGDIRGLYSNLITLSNLMDNHGSGAEALMYAQESLEHALTLRGDLYIGLSEASVASALETLGRLDEALIYAIQASDRYEKNDLKWGMQTAYSTLSSIQSKLGMKKESLNTAGKLVKICNEIGGTYNSMEYLMVAGSVYEKAGKKGKALSVYRRAERIARHLDIPKHLQELEERISFLL